MTIEELMALPFENIRENNLLPETPYLWFEINGFSYFLSTYQNEEGIFIPSYVYHGTDGVSCPICTKEKKYTIAQCCEKFKPHKNLIFERLKLSTNLRLLWLFR